MKQYKNWGFKNTALLVLSFILLFLFSEAPFLINLISRIGNLGYVSAFLAGIFFVSIFTVAPASIVLFDLASKLNPLLIAILAGAGAVIGDYVLFKFFKDRVFEELRPLFTKTSLSHVFKKTFKTPYFSWMIPLVGAFIIASPFPDEAGICLMGFSKIKRWQFVLITFLLNTAGILIVVTLAGSL